jgi:hypothetical protein
LAISLDDPGLILAKHHPRLIKLCRATVHRWLMTGQLEAVRIGARWFTTDAAVQRFFERCNSGNPHYAGATTASSKLKKAFAKFGLKARDEQ